jgi:hypothetical protein
MFYLSASFNRLAIEMHNKGRTNPVNMVAESKLELPTAAAMKWSGILALLGCIQVALSDTEILNFSSELHSTDATNLIPSDWSVFQALISSI